MPEMKLPSDEHPITIVATPGRVRGMFNGHLIVDSAGALTLKEASYKAVQYIPRDDVSMAFLHRTEHRTYCPYKGYASYFSLVMDGEIAENAVWSYEEPYPAMSAIAGALAFYPNHVEIYQLDQPHASTDGRRPRSPPAKDPNPRPPKRCNCLHRRPFARRWATC